MSLVALKLLGGRALAFLRGVPWWFWAGAAVIVAFAWQGHQAAKWQGRATVAEASLKTIADTQKTVDRNARANQVAKASQHADNNQETTDGLHKDLAAAGSLADALRVRIADLERARRANPLPGTGQSTGRVDDADDKRLSLTDELTLRNACEAERLYRTRLIDWEAKRYAIEISPPVAATDPTSR